MVKPVEHDYLRLLWRGSLQADALLSLDEAAAALPGDPEANARWLVKALEPAARGPSGDVYRWSDVVQALAAPPPTTRPVTRWRDAAEILGISEDTLARRRREHDPKRRCYFAPPADLRAWWQGLLEPEPTPAPKPSRPRRPRAAPSDDRPVNWAALARDLTRK